MKKSQEKRQQGRQGDTSLPWPLFHEAQSGAATSRCLPTHMGRLSGYMMYGETTFQTRRKHRTLFICSGPSCYRVWLDKAFNPLQFWVAQVIIFNSCSGHQFLRPSVWPFIQVWNWWQNPEIQVCVFSA